MRAAGNLFGYELAERVRRACGLFLSGAGTGWTDSTLVLQRDLFGFARCGVPQQGAGPHRRSETLQCLAEVSFDLGRTD